MELKEDRLNRFQNNPPEEIILTLLIFIENSIHKEIRKFSENNSSQHVLIILGIHSVALTISEAFFAQTGVEGYKLFLENYIDGETADTKFLSIAEEIHGLRNVMAHQWLSSLGHTIGTDYNMSFGWEKRGNETLINPRIYTEYYKKAFVFKGKIWDFKERFSKQELEDIKTRLIKKYLKR